MLMSLEKRSTMLKIWEIASAASLPNRAPPPSCQSNKQPMGWMAMSALASSGRKERERDRERESKTERRHNFISSLYISTICASVGLHYFVYKLMPLLELLISLFLTSENPVLDLLHNEADQSQEKA